MNSIKNLEALALKYKMYGELMELKLNTHNHVGGGVTVYFGGDYSICSIKFTPIEFYLFSDSMTLPLDYNLDDLEALHTDAKIHLQKLLKGDSK